MHFDEIMDLDLWVLPSSIGVEFDAEYGWAGDLHFFYLPDIIDEDAINEKSCVQVLEHLIAKADAEIFDLEDDLAILQSLLSWAEYDEHEKLYELWYMTFKEQIKLLSASLQMSRIGDAPSSCALNTGSEINHQPAKRICDIISALLRHHLPTKSKEGNCNSSDEETGVQYETTCASLGLPVTRTKKQPVTANFSMSRGFHIPDVRLNEKHEDVLASASETTGGSLTLVAEHHQEASPRLAQGNGFYISTLNTLSGILVVLDNDEKGGTKIARRTEGMQFQLDSEAKDELLHALKARPLQLTDVKVEYDEDETPANSAMVLSSQGSSRKKLRAKPVRLKKEIVRKRNRKELCIHDNDDANAGSKCLSISKGSCGKASTGIKAPEKQPVVASKSSDQNSGPSRDTKSRFAPSTETNDSASISCCGNLQKDIIKAEIDTEEQEAVASERTINDLRTMSRGKLMEMAKGRGLKKYHKLRKSLLVDMVAQTLGSCLR